MLSLTVIILVNEITLFVYCKLKLDINARRVAGTVVCNVVIRFYAAAYCRGYNSTLERVWKKEQNIT